LEIIIHRGAEEIGGSCVQIKTGQHSILIDAGLPLGETASTVNLATLNIDAVLISHPHQDHYGLIDDLAPSVPVYIGKIAGKLIAATRIFTGRTPLQNNFHYFKAGSSFEITPFRITPFLVDHSASDAFGFIVEADGQRMIYSGDFRAHGRKRKIFENFIKHPPQNIDLLLMEGTMMGRNGEKYQTEADIEAQMVNVLNDTVGAVFLVCSGQHIDRLCTAFRASRRSGRTFVVDIYTAWILQILSEHFDSTPHFTLKGIRVLARGASAKNHYLKIKDNSYFKQFINDIYKNENVITEAEIAATPHQYFIKNCRIDVLLKKLNQQQTGIIYSQWSGYLEKEKCKQFDWRLAALKSDSDVAFHHIHTSGHAFKQDLHRYLNAIKPKVVVPIHTECGDEYVKEFSSHHVKVIADGEVCQLVGGNNREVK